MAHQGPLENNLHLIKTWYNLHHIPFTWWYHSREFPLKLLAFSKRNPPVQREMNIIIKRSSFQRVKILECWVVNLTMAQVMVLCLMAPSHYQGWGLLKLRSLISPQAEFSILQKYLLDYLHHIHIWQVSPQLSCGNTCQIWTWYTIANMNFGDAENLGK